MAREKKVKLRDIAPKGSTLEQLINILPRTTYNCESYGLKLMVSSPKGWSCQYFTHYPDAKKTTDDRFRICIANTPEGAVRKMIGEFLRNDMGSTLKLSTTKKQLN